MNLMIVRAACWMVLLLCLFGIIILLDIWRIQFDRDKPVSALAMIVLAITLAAVSLVFAKCAWTGKFPQPHVEACT